MKLAEVDDEEPRDESEDDVYSDKMVEEFLDGDAIDLEEYAFMRGYNSS